MDYLNKRYVILWIIALSIGEFQHGYSMGQLSFNAKFIKDYYSLGSSDQSYFFAVSMVPIGATISSFLSGPLSYYGRRKLLLAANAILMCGTILLLIPGYSYILFIGRTLLGIAVGVFTMIVPLFILEISPIQK